MAEENPTWGYTRIRGALKNLGHRVRRSTIARILKAQGISPVPGRPTSWQTFLRAHWGAIAGEDFFTSEVWTWDIESQGVELLVAKPDIVTAGRHGVFVFLNRLGARARKVRAAVWRRGQPST